MYQCRLVRLAECKDYEHSGSIKCGENLNEVAVSCSGMQIDVREMVPSINSLLGTLLSTQQLYSVCGSLHV